MTLSEFRNLSTVKQVEFINSFAGGKLNLKELEKEHLEFTNVGKYIDKNIARWSKADKKFIFIKDDLTEKEEPKITLTQEEILFIKELYNKNELSEEINSIELKKIITRSIRVDAGTMELFIAYCNKNHLKQVNALTKALLDFIN